MFYIPNLVNFTLTNGLPMKQPHSCDDLSERKPFCREPYRYKPYHREPYRHMPPEPYCYKSHNQARDENDDHSNTARQIRLKIHSAARYSLMPADISKFRQKAQKKIRLSREEMKRLDKDYDRYAISRDRASVAGLLPGNTNRDAWASKYIEMETAKSNIRRHERAGNYLRYTPALRQALHEQADRLKAKPEQIEEEMAELKRQGKHDDALTRHHLHQQRQDRQRYRAEIKKHRKLLSQNE